MILEDAFKLLKRYDLIHSHREFSTDFLSRRPRHYDDLICSGRQPSPAVLASLALRLGEVAHPKRHDPGAAQQVAELVLLLARTFVELRKCFVTVLPRRRPIMNIPATLRK